MEIIAGVVSVKENKILMIREAKEKCYGKWGFPAGHVEVGETITDGAKRELLEETGCKAELKKVFPIFVHNTGNERVLMVHFLGDLVESGLSYNTDEILETKWMDIDEIKNMNVEKFRSYPVVSNIIRGLENNEMYSLDLFKNLQEI